MNQENEVCIYAIICRISVDTLQADDDFITYNVHNQF